MERSRQPLSRKARRRAILALALFALGALLYDSNFRLHTDRVELLCPALPAAFEGFRVVQLTDLHGREFGRGNEKLLAAVAAEEPDLIVLTGDFIESADDLPAVDRLTAQLTKLAPVYFVSGNHDWASGEISALAALLERNGVRYLRNEAERFEKDGQSILIAGVEDPNSWAAMLRPDALAAQLNETDPGSFILLLGHRNYWVEEYPDLPVDLIFCGHTHGGVIRLPVVGGLLGTNKDLFPVHEAGVFVSGRYTMVVSTGLTGSHGIPRFLNNPQVLSAVLRRG